MSGQQRLFDPAPVDWTGREKRAAESRREAMFSADGSPKRLLWCSDEARLGGCCPYSGGRARFMPHGGCCKDLVREMNGGVRR